MRFHSLEYFKRMTDYLRDLTLTLWICRVSTLSVVASFILFWNAPQARDLFIEVTGNTLSGVLFWTWFFLTAFVFWLLPMHTSARFALLVDPHANDKSSQHIYARILSIYPRFLVILSLLSLLLGVLYAYEYLPNSESEDIVQSAQTHLALLLMITGTAIAVVILFEPIRQLLTRRRTNLRARAPNRASHAELEPQSSSMETSGPYAAPEPTKVGMGNPTRQLAFPTTMLVISTISAAVMLAVSPQVVADLFPRATLMPILLGFWIAPLTFLGVLSRRVKFPLLIILLIAVSIMGAFSDNDHHQVRVGRITPTSLPLNQDANNTCGSPEWSVSIDGQCQRITFPTALNYWKRANDCEAERRDSPCPKVIIVSAAGGASRAAFFTSSVLALLEDLSHADDAEFRPFSKQLFALSTVSGSSIGAAYFLAANELLNTTGAPREALEKAFQFGVKDHQWFRSTTKAQGGARPKDVSWKDAMQILTSGDFLTPTIAAMVLRDAVPIAGFIGHADRAVALETAVEKRFADVFELGASTNPLQRPLTSFAPSPDVWRPILFANSSSVETGHRIIASAVAPEVAGLSKQRDPQQQSQWKVLFVDSYDLLDMLNSNRLPGKSPEDVINEARFVRRDVRLSTAALASARFPVVSPHGTITNVVGRPIDRVVDGGYFESNGALTVVDIVDAVLRARVIEDDQSGNIDSEKGDRRGVLILQITNDPEPGRCPEKGQFDPSAVIPMPTTGSRRLLGTLSSIVEGVASARVARGTHASEFLSSYLSDDDQPYFAWRDEGNPGFVHIRVCPQRLAETDDKVGKFRDLSMSWWLSHPVQSYLDGQLCESGNLKGLSKVLLVLSKKFDDSKQEEMGKLREMYETKVSQWLGCSPRG